MREKASPLKTHRHMYETMRLSARGRLPPHSTMESWSRRYHNETRALVSEGK